MNACCCRCTRPNKPAPARHSAVELATGAATLSDDLNTPMPRRDMFGKTAHVLPETPRLTPKDAAYYSTYYPALYN